MDAAKPMEMGLGEAILRLMEVEAQLRNRYGEVPDNLRQERTMIREALDSIRLDLNFSCVIPDAPADVTIFQKSVTESCCRLDLGKPDGSRKKPKAPQRKKTTTTKKRVAASRKAPAKKTTTTKKKGFLGGLLGGNDE